MLTLNERIYKRERRPKITIMNTTIKLTKPNSFLKVAPRSIPQKAPGLMEKIAIPTSDGYHFLLVKDIVYLQAEGNYTTIFMEDGSSHMVSKCLKNFIQYLEPNNFCRIHSSYLINISYVKSFQKGSGAYIIMDNDQKLKVSRSGKQLFLNSIKWLI